LAEIGCHPRRAISVTPFEKGATAVPTINAEPDYQVSIDVDDEFISKFIKAPINTI
jgi:hypothetical protein